MTLPPQIVGQITPNGLQPYSNQQNFGQVIGEVQSWNSAADPAMVMQWIQEAYRKYIDYRMWYGLMTKGQIATSGFYQAGNIALVNGSASVQGTGTAWTAGMVGQQLRVGFTAPIYNIINVDTVNQVLTLELPWGLPTIFSSGYFITQYYFSFPNIKYFYSVKNLQLMYRLCTNVPQSLIENLDPSRLTMMFPRVLATMPPDSSGNYQVELWPNPQTQQAFPYIAYVQPPNLVNDDDNFFPYIRTDIIKKHALSQAMSYKPRSNPDYSEATCLQLATRFLKEYEVEIQSAAGSDEALFRQDIERFSEGLPYIDPRTGSWPGGATLAAMSAQLGGGMDDGW